METLYISGRKRVELEGNEVLLGQLLSMECANAKVVEQLKKRVIFRLPDQKAKRRGRYVISILKLIEEIHKLEPALVVESLGAEEVIVSCEEQNGFRTGEYLRVAVVLLITFIGAAFAVMAFHNDISVEKLFEKICLQVTGSKTQGMFFLKLSYSVGMAAGILLFFNHFGKWRLTKDPTPMEVEMRTYENEIQTTLVEHYNREGKTIDVE